MDDSNMSVVKLNWQQNQTDSSYAFSIVIPVRRYIGFPYHMPLHQKSHRKEGFSWHLARGRQRGTDVPPGGEKTAYGINPKRSKKRSVVQYC